MAKPFPENKHGTAEMSERRVDIVGGGLAGLLAAIELSTHGVQATVLEAASEFGGRARTRDVKGFLFNRGPHALYREGALRRQLDRFDIPYTGGPALSGTRQAISGGRLHHLPSTPGSIVKTSLFGFTDKISYARIFKKVMGGATGAGSFAQWLGEQRISPAVRTAVEAMGRLSSYANGSADVSAKALLDQIRLTTGGTIYVDGGWANLVDGLSKTARHRVAELNDRAPVARVSCVAGRPEIVMGDGAVRTPDAVIMAVGPQEAAELAPDVPSLLSEAREVHAVRANTLDLGLRRLPPNARDFALGIDAPFYLSVHSGSANLTPAGGALVHVVKYLPIGEPPAKYLVEELEGVADLVMPGWREEEVTRQTLRGMVVSHGLPRWDRPRASVEIIDAPGLFLAGDWVGDVGMVGDAAAASAIQAAQCARYWVSLPKAL
ncbi:FAD-dependent oxidoreductase [Hansschlegelia sp. KR7-227]|uniref:FAD-dependent oxidoreductase n=1 Tax=Hansschlegelia sp. KR7-227 TaxID=3400914 RepID=UPI003BFF3948